MKLRIIKKDCLYLPQWFGKKGYGWGDNWNNFKVNTKILRFENKQDAIDLLNIFTKSVEVQKQKVKREEVIWSNLPIKK